LVGGINIRLYCLVPVVPGFVSSLCLQNKKGRLGFSCCASCTGKEKLHNPVPQIPLLKFFPDVAILFNPRNVHLNRKSFFTVILPPVHVYNGGLLAFLEVETLKELTLKSFTVVRRAHHIEKN
jgi:hypothetical protein